MRRKPRKLTSEETRLWRKVAEQLNPLRAELEPDGPEELEAGTPQAPSTGDSAAQTPPRVLSLPGRRPRHEPPIRIDLAPDPMKDPALLAAPRMDARAFSRLKRGKLLPEARIDLHGMTAERAHGALRHFILDAHMRGLRLVLVITGKGRDDPEESWSSPARRGVLRNAVPHWLAQPPLSLVVLQIAPAHHRHGGGGAYYVYLRRQR